MPTKTRPAEPMSPAVAHRPPEPTTEELALSQSTGGTTTTAQDLLGNPTFEPPTTAAGATATVAAGWLTNKHVLMLWQTGNPMDHWMYLDGGTGWRQGTQANDVAARGIGLLATGARTGGGLVHVYEGAGGAVDGIYLW